MRRATTRMLQGLLIVAVFAAFALAAQADTIASAETKQDSLVNGSSKSWDFTGTQGNRVVITTAEQTGGVSPDIYLYFNSPTLGLVLEDTRTGPFFDERMERTLSSTGTYTITIRENGANNSGFFSCALAIILGATTSSSDSDGGSLSSGATFVGTFGYQADTDMFTFTATKDDRVIVTTSDLSFSCNPEIYIYPPSGAAAEASRTGSTSQKRLEMRVAETGTYTILISDFQRDQEGTYAVSLVKIPGDATSASDTDGGPIASGATMTGVLTPKADMDVYTFGGTAGDRVIITTADSNSSQAEIYLYPPGGEALEASSIGAFTSHRIERQLSATGTYTIVVQDSGLNSEGAYSISLAKLPGATTSATDTDGGLLASGSYKVGRLLNRADTDIYQFWGEKDARVLITTAGLTTDLQPEIYLYPDHGGDLIASDKGGLVNHQLEVLLPASGLYNIVVTDYANRHDDGYYSINMTMIGATASTGTSPPIIRRFIVSQLVPSLSVSERPRS